MSNNHLQSVAAAVEDFRRARGRASMQWLLDRLSGKQHDLLSYDEVIEKLRLSSVSGRRLEQVPLERIVGSVGRYRDFTRTFLPRSPVGEQRWARVKQAMTGLTGVPPIEVYRIDDWYFVRDGNHRVSVAREMGVPSIQGYVTDVTTRVPLDPDDSPDELIIKAEHADFLAKTSFDKRLPHVDMTLTEPGQYGHLLEHIEVHRYYLGLEEQRDISLAEAIASWYRRVYLPIAKVIRERGILHDFPGRTEADLYLWILRHRAALERGLGWAVNPDKALDDLRTRHGNGRSTDRRDVRRERVRDDRPPPSPRPLFTDYETPARVTDAVRSVASLREFDDILVAVDGTERGWLAVEQAAVLARYEGVELDALHVVASEDGAESDAVESLRDELERRCAAAGVTARLAVAVGKPGKQLLARSRFADVLVVAPDEPPANASLVRMTQGFATLLRRCPRPILSVPSHRAFLGEVLVAYNGRSKADEALSIGAYAASRWGSSLTVLSADDGRIDSGEALERARAYLDGLHIEADFVEEELDAPAAIRRTANERKVDLVIVGGYRNRALELVRGSLLHPLLRTLHQPVLICT